MSHFELRAAIGLRAGLGNFLLHKYLVRHFWKKSTELLKAADLKCAATVNIMSGPPGKARPPRPGSWLDFDK